MQKTFVLLLCLLLFLLSSSCRADFGGSDNRRTLIADYIIVGGGGGGCKIARTLAEDPANYRIVVLEQGSAPDASVTGDLGTHIGFVDTPNERHYHAVAQEFAFSRKAYFPTFEGLGGSTSIYGATAVTPDQAWWDQKMPAGYKFANMLPVIKSWQNHYCHYLPSSYTGISAANCTAFHGKNGPMSIGTQYHQAVTPVIQDLLTSARAVIGTTYDYNGAVRAGANYEDNYKVLANMSDPSSAPTKLSSWLAFLPQSFLASHPRLEIRTLSKAVRLLFSQSDSKRVIGVEYVSGNNDVIQRVYARREVIVSLGVIGTPKFLQANGIGPADLLGKINVPIVAVNNAVGANLTAHQGYLTAYKVNTSLPQNPNFWSNNVIDFFFPSGLSSLPADIQVSVLNGVYGEYTAPEDGTPGQDLIYTLRHLIDTGNFGPLVTGDWQRYVGLVVFSTDPAAIGWVNATGPNVDKQPTIDYGWSEATIRGTSDFAKLNVALNITRRILTTTPFGLKYNAKEIVPGPDYVTKVGQFYPELSGAALQAKADEMFIRYSLTHFYHVTGSCRLGQATDLDGRVNGVKRLRVCDNSLLPQPNGNPSGALYTVCTEIGNRIRAAAVNPSSDECREQSDYFD